MGYLHMFILFICFYGIFKNEQDRKTANYIYIFRKKAGWAQQQHPLSTGGAMTDAYMFYSYQHMYAGRQASSASLASLHAEAAGTEAYALAAAETFGLADARAVRVARAGTLVPVAWRLALPRHGHAHRALMHLCTHKQPNHQQHACER
jgi:hypothetical protein